MNLTPGDVEAVALRVVELLEERRMAHGASELVDAVTLARRLGVSASYVYSHANDLGAVRLGDGPKPRLRFNADEALAAYKAMTPALYRSGNSPPASARPRRRPKTSTTAPLLPVKGVA